MTRSVVFWWRILAVLLAGAGLVYALSHRAPVTASAATTTAAAANPAAAAAIFVSGVPTHVDSGLSGECLTSGFTIGHDTSCVVFVPGGIPGAAILSTDNGQCLDITDGKPVLAACNGSATQRWSTSDPDGVTPYPTPEIESPLWQVVGGGKQCLTDRSTDPSALGGSVVLAPCGPSPLADTQVWGDAQSPR